MGQSPPAGRLMLILIGVGVIFLLLLTALGQQSSSTASSPEEADWDTITERPSTHKVVREVVENNAPPPEPEPEKEPEPEPEPEEKEQEAPQGQRGDSRSSTRSEDRTIDPENDPYRRTDVKRDTEACRVFNSQHSQDWFFVKNFIKPDSKPGFYLDVGANHFRTLSNTYYLDHCLGWRGICVEPNPELAKLLRDKRTCMVANQCASDKKGVLPLVVSGPHVAAFIHVPGTKLKPGERTVDVPCGRISELLEAAKVDKIDFMTLDVEGHEPHALAGMPWSVNGGREGREGSALPLLPDMIVVEISTGRIQRALTQIPILMAGYQGLTPLVGDGIFIRQHPRLSRFSLQFPHTPYFKNWWRRLCLTFESLPPALCTSLGGKEAVAEPPTEGKEQDAKGSDAESDHEREKTPGYISQSAAYSLIETAVSEAGKKCEKVLEGARGTGKLYHPHGLDWFTLFNYGIQDGRVRSTGTYVEISADPSKSNTRFFDECLGWKGVCVALTAEQKEEYQRTRSCSIVEAYKLPCVKPECGRRQTAPTDPAQRTILKDVLANLPSGTVDLLSMDTAVSPFVIGNSEWSEVYRFELIAVNGVPTTNYKLMHWPLSIRGYALAGTFHGSDLFVKRAPHLLRPGSRSLWPVDNKVWKEWLVSEYSKTGVPENTINALLR